MEHHTKQQGTSDTHSPPSAVPGAASRLIIFPFPAATMKLFLAITALLAT
jgi:hypothetical protein